MGAERNSFFDRNSGNSGNNNPFPDSGDPGHDPFFSPEGSPRGDFNSPRSSKSNLEPFSVDDSFGPYGPPSGPRTPVDSNFGNTGASFSSNSNFGGGGNTEPQTNASNTNSALTTSNFDDSNSISGGSGQTPQTSQTSKQTATGGTGLVVEDLTSSLDPSQRESREPTRRSISYSGAPLPVNQFSKKGSEDFPESGTSHSLAPRYRSEIWSDQPDQTYDSQPDQIRRYGLDQAGNADFSANFPKRVQISDRHSTSGRHSGGILHPAINNFAAKPNQNSMNAGRGSDGYVSGIHFDPDRDRDRDRDHDDPDDPFGLSGTSGPQKKRSKPSHFDFDGGAMR